MPDPHGAALANADRRFDLILQDRGEAVCIASLPGLAEEIAEDEAGGNQGAGGGDRPPSAGARRAADLSSESRAVPGAFRCARVHATLRR